MKRDEVFALISKERERQEKMFPGSFSMMSDGDAGLVLTEEYGEWAEAVLQGRLPDSVEEMTQVAAVAVAWLEARGTSYTSRTWASAKEKEKS